MDSDRRGSVAEAWARGRAFERDVVTAWQAAGILTTGTQAGVRTHGHRGYIDLWDDAAGLLVICELKDVDWGRLTSVRAMKNVQRHKNQIWKYLLADGMPDDAALVIIYSRQPEANDLAGAVEAYLEEWSVMTLWWDRDQGKHWIVPETPAEPVAAKSWHDRALASPPTAVHEAKHHKPARISERVVFDTPAES